MWREGTELTALSCATALASEVPEGLHMMKVVTGARRLQSGVGWQGSGSPEGSPLTYFRVLQSCQEVCGGPESKHGGGLQSETARDLLWLRAGRMVNFLNSAP